MGRGVGHPDLGNKSQSGLQSWSFHISLGFVDVVTLLRVVVLGKTGHAWLAVVVSALGAKGGFYLFWIIQGPGVVLENSCWTGLKSWLGISGCCRNTFESVLNVLKWEMPQGSARRCDGHGEEHPAWARRSLHASRGTPQGDSASSSCPS